MIFTLDQLNLKFELYNKLSIKDLIKDIHLRISLKSVVG